MGMACALWVKPCPARGHTGAQTGNCGTEKCHPSNRELFDYWNERRGEGWRRSGPRSNRPASGTVLGDTRIEVNKGNHLFRIAGTRLCALFGRELKTESFLLLQRSAQAAMRELIAVVMEEKVGIVASCSGATSGRDTLAPAQLEMVQGCRWYPRSAAKHA